MKFVFLWGVSFVVILFIVTDLRFMDICMPSPYTNLFISKLKRFSSANAAVTSHMESGKETCVLELQNSNEGQTLRGEE